MQPILAESAPHPGRAVAFTIALAIVASLLMIPISRHHRPAHGEHHRLPRIGKCVTSHGGWRVRGNPPVIYRSADRAAAGIASPD